MTKSESVREIAERIAYGSIRVEDIEKAIIETRNQALVEAADMTRHITVSDYHGIDAEVLRIAAKKILSLITPPEGK